MFWKPIFTPGPFVTPRPQGGTVTLTKKHRKYSALQDPNKDFL